MVVAFIFYWLLIYFRLCQLSWNFHLIGLVVKASASRGADPGFNSRFLWVESYQLALQWLPCPVPGIIGSALGLVDLVSVYCDLMRDQSLMCNFYLSVAAHKIVWADPSACWWNIKQPTNQQTISEIVQTLNWPNSFSSQILPWGDCTGWQSVEH